jgi:hypothetical protein
MSQIELKISLSKLLFSIFVKSDPALKEKKRKEKGQKKKKKKKNIFPHTVVCRADKNLCKIRNHHNFPIFLVHSLFMVNCTHSHINPCEKKRLCVCLPWWPRYPQNTKKNFVKKSPIFSTYFLQVRILCLHFNGNGNGGGRSSKLW